MPFGVWIFFILLEHELHLVRPTAFTYALRTVCTLAAACWYRPWRWYPPLRIRNLGWAFVVGVAVFVVWVLPEMDWVGERMPGLQRGYLRFGILWPWEVPEAVTESPYAPEVCGWPLSLMRLFGSAVVIAVVEEFFWRGWLYRWLAARDFRNVCLGFWDVKLFLVAALLFGLEHTRWLVGFAAGVAYLGMMIRTRDLWAVCVAHGITNFLLGLYVLAQSAYAFW